MRRLLTALSCVIAMACALPLPTLAQDLPIVGVWEGADRAALSIYGTLKVSRTGMSWGGHVRHYPACKVSYTPVAEQNGVEFRDQLGRVHVLAPDSPFRTWLLNIKGGKCTNGVSQLRFTIAHDDPSHLAVVEYRAGGEPVGWIHFARR